MINIVVVDDHAFVRNALERMLHSPPELRVVGRASTGEEAIALAAELRPDIVLMDVLMPGMSGPAATRRILAANPAVRVVMLSASENEFDLLASIQSGAVGYLPKTLSEDELIAAIRTVHAGSSVVPPRLIATLFDALQPQGSGHDRVCEELTDRERDVLVWIAQGSTNAEVAARLGISVHTVKTHVRNIMHKLALDNRAQVAAFAVRTGCGRARQGVSPLAAPEILAPPLLPFT